jgi:hypothetical protein
VGVSANVGGSPDPAKSKYGSGPLDDRGGVDDATILRHLAPLRAARTWLPAPTAGDATNVQLHRVLVSGGAAGAVELRGNE